MSRLARLAMKLSRLQQDHLHDVYNVVESKGIMIQAMEWVDGYDLRRLLTPQTLEQVRETVRPEPLGLRERCHRHSHIGTAADEARDRDLDDPGMSPRGRCLAPRRADPCRLEARQHHGQADRQLQNHRLRLRIRGRRQTSTQHLDTTLLRHRSPAGSTLHTPASDLASLGYILFEMLSGQYPFSGVHSEEELIAAKKLLPKQLPCLLPEDVVRNSTLVNFLAKMIAVKPEDRFASAEDADLSEFGAAAFERELVKGDLSSEYENELRLWLAELE